jgi:hypothetical protein
VAFTHRGACRRTRSDRRALIGKKGCARWLDVRGVRRYVAIQSPQ